MQLLTHCWQMLSLSPAAMGTSQAAPPSFYIVAMTFCVWNIPLASLDQLSWPRSLPAPGALLAGRAAKSLAQGEHQPKHQGVIDIILNPSAKHSSALGKWAPSQPKAGHLVTQGSQCRNTSTLWAALLQLFIQFPFSEASLRGHGEQSDWVTTNPILQSREWTFPAQHSQSVKLWVDVIAWHSCNSSINTDLNKNCSTSVCPSELGFVSLDLRLQFEAVHYLMAWSSHSSARHGSHMQEQALWSLRAWNVQKAACIKRCAQNRGTSFAVHTLTPLGNWITASLQATATTRLFWTNSRYFNKSLFLKWPTAPNPSRL